MRAIEEKKLPRERLLVGVGAGGELDRFARQCSRSGPSARCGRASGSGCAWPSYGRHGGQEADAVLLNRLTPRQARSSTQEVSATGKARDEICEVIAYVRVALPDGFEQLAGEGDRYASFPHMRGILRGCRRSRCKPAPMARERRFSLGWRRSTRTWTKPWCVRCPIGKRSMRTWGFSEDSSRAEGEIRKLGQFDSCQCASQRRAPDRPRR